MNLRVWDVVQDKKLMKDTSTSKAFEHHTEFVLGIDWNNFNEGIIATTAWDETVTVFNTAKSFKVKK